MLASASNIVNSFLGTWLITDDYLCIDTLLAWYCPKERMYRDKRPLLFSYYHTACEVIESIERIIL